MLNSAKFRVIHSNILRPAKTDRSRTTHQVATALISLNGVRFETQIREASGYDLMVDFSRPLPELKLGQHLHVVFLTSIPTVEISIPGIVHWVSGETSSVAMGIMLASPVPPEFMACHPACLRSSIRFQCKVRGEVHYTTVGTSSVASILNYSRHGLCLQTRTLPPVGTKFRFAWNQASVEGLVRWVTGQGDSLIAGCEIVGKPGYILSGLPASALTFKETPLFD